MSGKCPTPDQLAQYYHGNVSSEFSRWIVSHICECEKCSTALKALRAASRAEVIPASANATITISGGGIADRSMFDESLEPARAAQDDTREVKSEAQKKDTRELDRSEESRLKADRAEQPKPQKKPEPPTRAANTVADIRSLQQSDEADQLKEAAKLAESRQPTRPKQNLEKTRPNATVQIPAGEAARITDRPKPVQEDISKPAEPEAPKGKATDTTAIGPAGIGDEKPSQAKPDIPDSKPPKATDTTAIDPGEAAAAAKSQPPPEAHPSEAAKKPEPARQPEPKPAAKQPEPAKPAPQAKAPAARQPEPPKPAPKPQPAQSKQPAPSKPASAKPAPPAPKPPASAKSAPPQPQASTSEPRAPKKSKQRRQRKKLPRLGPAAKEQPVEQEENPPDMRAADQELSKLLESDSVADEAARLNEAIMEFGDALDKTRLVEWDELEEFMAELNYPQVDPQILARELVQAEMLSGYQAGMLLNGRADELVVGDYCILEMIAESGLGTRYVAMHRETRDLVALKVVSGEEYVNSQVEQARSLEGPHLNRVLEEGCDGDVAYVVSEYLPGGDLAQRVRHKVRLSPEEAAEVILQAARALQAAASQKIVHGNLCPTNLVLGEEDVVHVTDFGWDGVRSIPDMPEDEEADLTSSGTAMGVPTRVGLLAPEILNRKSGTTVGSDIYSLGITLAYLTMGVPWNLNKRFDDKADNLPNIKECMHQAPRPLQWVLRKMCAKDPRQRFQNYDQVIDALTKLLDPEQHEALEKSLGAIGAPVNEPQQKGTEENATRVLILAAMLVLAVAVLTAWKMGLF